MRQNINTAHAPAAIGPYSQAVHQGNLIFTSGQLPLDPKTGEIVGSDIATQTRRVLDNLVAVLAAAGATPGQVVKTTCFLDNMNDFAAFNEVYLHYFPENPPARSCVAVEKLPKSALVEIEALAII